MSYYKVELLKRSLRKGLKTFLTQLFFMVRHYLSGRIYEKIYAIDCDKIKNDPRFGLEGLDCYTYKTWEEIPFEFRKIFDNKNESILFKTKSNLSKGWRVWLLTIDKNPAVVGYSYPGNVAHNFYFPMTDSSIYIHYIYTLPQYRGRGILPLLLKHMMYMSKTEGFERAFIIVDEYNISSIRSIEKAGFQPIGRGIINIHTGGKKWYPQNIPPLPSLITLKAIKTP